MAMKEQSAFPKPPAINCLVSYPGQAFGVELGYPSFVLSFSLSLFLSCLCHCLSLCLSVSHHHHQQHQSFSFFPRSPLVLPFLLISFFFLFLSVCLSVCLCLFHHHHPSFSFFFPLSSCATNFFLYLLYSLSLPLSLSHHHHHHFSFFFPLSSCTNIFSSIFSTLSLSLSLSLPIYIYGYIYISSSFFLSFSHSPPVLPFLCLLCLPANSTQANNCSANSVASLHTSLHLQSNPTRMTYLNGWLQKTGRNKKVDPDKRLVTLLCGNRLHIKGHSRRNWIARVEL